MHNSILSPSMMCVSHWSDTKGIINKMVECGVEVLHVDVMDGSFVPNLMLGTESTKLLRKISPIPLDIHLMIDSPEEKLAWFDIQPSEWVSVHVESTRHVHRALSRVHEYGAKTTVALNPATPLVMIEDVVDDVDAVLLMTVNPGFAGQKMIPQVLEKITRLRKLLDDRGRQHVRIEVDGNVSFENAVKMRAAGADMFVCGTSSIFAKSGTLAENIARIRNCVK